MTDIFDEVYFALACLIITLDMENMHSDYVATLIQEWLTNLAQLFYFLTVS